MIMAIMIKVSTWLFQLVFEKFLPKNIGSRKVYIYFGTEHEYEYIRFP